MRGGALGLIYVSVSCYGSDGPWATRAGYDPLGQVASGLAAGEGSLDAPLMASTFTLNDYLAAYLAAAGVNSALLRRAREGGSYHVKTSLTAASCYVQMLGQLPRQYLAGRGGGCGAAARSGARGANHHRYPLWRDRAPAGRYRNIPKRPRSGKFPPNPRCASVSRLAHVGSARGGPTE